MTLCDRSTQGLGCDGGEGEGVRKHPNSHDVIYEWSLFRSSLLQKNGHTYGTKYHISEDNSAGLVKLAK